MTDTQLKSDSSPDKWQFNELKRWQITVILKTVSPLHIGDGGTISRKIRDSQGKNREVEVNSVITGTMDDLPIIPGSTLKGRLRNYLSTRMLAKKTLLDAVFGKGSSATNDMEGNGGLAEFHDAYLVAVPEEAESNFSDWNDDRKTYIETSTAINRHSGSALDSSLHYTECVPPGTRFAVKITGAMEDSQAALIIAALQAIGADERLYLGAEDANGKGKITLADSIVVKQLGPAEILTWLGDCSDLKMAISQYRTLDSQTEVKKLVQDHIGSTVKKDINPEDTFDIILHLDGPFLVNDPTKTGTGANETNFYPLLDENKNSLLPVRSFRGAFRAQGERIIRTLGGHCCDSSSTGSCRAGEKLCIGCEMFGGTGWKTTIAIDIFQNITAEKRPLIRQDFIAIDRFHGGGKDGAKFQANYSQSPVFKSTLTITERIAEEERKWRRGLLALLFRDLREGDINLGFGINKGYGSIAKVEISSKGQNVEIAESDIQAFLTRCNRNGQTGTYSCNSTKEPCDKTGTTDLAKILSPSTTEEQKFHNPYHFIPVKEPDTTKWCKKQEYATDQSPHSHGFYRSETDDKPPLFHGRIICKLTSETPFFIGGQDAPERQQVEKQATLKESYCLDGELALPATTLRGLISSLAEAASNSAMRVLDDGIISHRKEAEDALKKIGMMYLDKGEWRLVPLVRNIASNAVKLKNAYIAGSACEAIVAGNNSWSPQHNVVYYLPKGSNRADVIFDTYSTGVQCGILRILGKDNNRENELENKKHELFLPIETKFIDTEKNTFDYKKYCREKSSLPVSEPEAIQRYLELANQRSKTQKNNKVLKDDTDCMSTKWLPFHLKGDARLRDQDVCTLPVKEYGLFYYSDTGGEVREIAYSSIWRDKIKDTTGMFFPTDLIPFHKGRETISPAELLFGFTEYNDDKGKGQHGLAFKGKVRVSAGVLSSESAGKQENEILGKEIKLKVLATPKPPCPAFYFTSKKGNQTFIKKQDLSSETHQVQGRKIYLHATRDEKENTKVKKITSTGYFADDSAGNYPWVSRNDDKDHLKVRFRPIKEGNSFFFHLDFNNLTQWEIGMLCYVLRPGEAFRHKIGMGKPLGLGSVKIDIAALQTINRKKRYRNASQEKERYNEGGWLTDEEKLRAELIDLYSDISSKEGRLSPIDCRKNFIATMDADIYRAFELLGNPHHIKNPVHYPQVNSINNRQADIEKENFEWFKANDSQDKNDTLQPLNSSITSLKPLTRHEQKN